MALRYDAIVDHRGALERFLFDLFERDEEIFFRIDRWCDSSMGESRLNANSLK